MSQSGSFNSGSSGGGVTSVTGTNGVTASPTTGAVVVSGVNATTSSVGVASFNPADFTVSGAGQVSLIGGPAITSVLTANATPQFAVVGSTSTVNFGLTNLLLGASGSAISGATESVGIGDGALAALTSGPGNCAGGYASQFSMKTGSNNTSWGATSLQSAVSCLNTVAIGASAMSNFTGTGTVGNIAIGSGTLNAALWTGDGNICIGQGSGENFAGTESWNIFIGNFGVVGDNNIIRIGTTGSGNSQQNKCFIAAITGVTVASSAVVGVNSSGQLSSLGTGTSGQVLTSTGTTSPTWQSPVTSNTAFASVAKDSAVSLSTTSPAQVTSISLGAGTWSISGIINFTGNPTVTGAQFASVNTSVAIGTQGVNATSSVWLTTNFTAGDVTLTVPNYILVVPSTETISLVAEGTFSAGSLSAYGSISAIRLL